MIQVPLHSRFETAFEGARFYKNPVQDVRVTVEFTHNAGSFQVDAFWDGAQCWRVRFSPPYTERWTWRTRSSQTDDSGLDGQNGQFECIKGLSMNEWLTNGPLEVSADGRHLEYRNHSPFFWLADTVWNGPLKAAKTDWEIYLADRKRKGFSVIQFVATQWLGGDTDAEGRTAYSHPEKIEIDPAFFQRLDERINRIGDYGMVAAPVLAWAATWNEDGIGLNPGASLSEDQLIVLLRYLVSRYGAHQVVWMLAGDGNYLGANAEAGGAQVERLLRVRLGSPLSIPQGGFGSTESLRASPGTASMATKAASGMTLRVPAGLMREYWEIPVPRQPTPNRYLLSIWSHVMRTIFLWTCQDRRESMRILSGAPAIGAFSLLRLRAFLMAPMAFGVGRKYLLSP